MNNSITTFEDACSFIQKLPYGRNANKKDITTVFIDQCATCSTKHALLKILAEENRYTDLQLMLGIFKMNEKNTPKVKAVLRQYQLDYIPEAHNYLKWQNLNVDFTHITSQSSDFENDLLEEIEIQPDQITDFKVDYHKQYLNNWLKDQYSLNYTLDELWSIREQCIVALSI